MEGVRLEKGREFPYHYPVMKFFAMLKKAVLPFYIFLFVYVILYSTRYQLNQKIYEHLSIEMNDFSSVEYGEDFSLEDTYESYVGELVTTGEVDTSQTGSYVVVYQLSEKEPYFGTVISRSFEKVIEVIDSQSPVIELESETVNINVHSSYDISVDNIVSVRDAVDGELSAENVSVFCSGDYSRAGEYTVTVIATDSNGLMTSESYQLIVEEKITSRTPVNYYRIYDYLLEHFDFNRAAACGILANIRFECNFNPESEGTTFYGLFQWGYGRRERLISWCSANGYAYNSLEGQLEFMYQELTNSYPSVKKFLEETEDSEQGAYDAAVFFCNKYEGAASSKGRDELASWYYNN